MPKIFYFTPITCLALQFLSRMKKRTRNRLFASIICLLLIAGVLVFLSRRHTIRYPGFGIRIPNGYVTHGIDVSRYQQCIDWEQVSLMRDGGHSIEFAIARATEGTDRVDPCFDQNWKGMKEQHLIRGAYLYFHPNRNGEEQAQFFMHHVNLEKGDLPPVIDIEETNNTDDSSIHVVLKQCAVLLEAQYGCKPIIYTNVSFYKNRLGDEFNDYPLWAAHYDQCDTPRIGRSWQLWQHNCKGRVNGIAAEVDFNVVNGNLFTLRQLCLK